MQEEKELREIEVICSCEGQDAFEKNKTRGATYKQIAKAIFQWHKSHRLKWLEGQKKELANFLWKYKFAGEVEMGHKYFKDNGDTGETIIIFYKKFAKDLSNMIIQELKRRAKG